MSVIFLQFLYTLLVVVCGFVIFRADTTGQAAHILKAMFTGFHADPAEMVLLEKLLTPYNVVCTLAAAVLSTPFSVWTGQKIKCQAVRYVGAVLLLVLCMMSLASGSYNPFIYFRF